jgi:hypothetical protein
MVRLGVVKAASWAAAAGKVVTLAHSCRAHPILGSALDYWLRIRGGRAMPARRDIEPADVPALLPHLQLVDIVAGRFRYRLVGTALVEAFGRDYTGQYPDEMFESARGPYICNVFTTVREARRPIYLRSHYVTTRNVELVAERLYMPLSQDGTEVDMILGALAFEFGALEAVAGAWGSAALVPARAEPEIVPLTDI